MASAVTSSNLGEKIFSAAKGEFGSRFKAVKQFLKAESEKLAITLRMIIQGVAAGTISEDEAKILLNQQKVAASAVLTAAKGMTAVAVQSAINAGLGVVKQFVNGKVGFALV